MVGAFIMQKRGNMITLLLIGLIVFSEGINQFIEGNGV